MLVALVAMAIAAGSASAAGPLTVTGASTTPDTAPLGYASAPTGYTVSNDGLGVPSGAIKHVWVIMMENHAYETNFTGLNNNSYLSKSLPQVGAELTNYYGTGHSSLDNYLTSVSGQAPMTDDQGDCPAYTAASGSVDTAQAGGTDGDYGQFKSAAGPNAPAGDNGCVYPSTVPTLFNQLDAAGDSWKEYAQDLSGTTGDGLTPVAGQNAGAAYCGAPDSAVGPTPALSQGSNPGATGSNYYVKGSAVPADQYVAKHNPTAWFQSVMGDATATAAVAGSSATDCNSSHIGTIFNGAADSLYNDLQSESTTPALSYISPNNCSDGHDAVCAGTTTATNNLSGMAAGAPTNASEGTPTNTVGGSYASDLFLEHVVPEIMKSPAYSDGGLIAVVWDESYPQFTYSSDSFVDSAVASPTAHQSLLGASAGETLFGKSLNWEPSGPNVPNVQSSAGQQLAAGPGYNEYLDRPSEASTNNTGPLVGCEPDSVAANGFNTVTIPTGSSSADGCYVGGGDLQGSTQTGAYSFSAPRTLSNVVLNANGTATQGGVSASGLVSPNIEGEQVTLPSGVTASTSPVYIGQVTSSTEPVNGTSTYTGTTANTTPVDTSATDNNPTVTFQLVDATGTPVSITAGTGTAQTLTTQGQTPANDPLYDAFDGTTGGGDTGAILISPYIKGGTVSNNYYNHYSLLRSLEDMLQVSNATGTSAPYTGSISLSKGVDGLGHLGYAAQPGLAPFGTDVFTASPLDVTSTVTKTTTTPAVTSTVNKTVTQTVTQSLPGSIFTVTTPGGTTKVKVVATKVPKLTGLTKAQASEVLASEGLKLGSVKSPKAKSGYTGVVSAANPGAGKTVEKGAKVNLTLKLVKG